MIPVEEHPNTNDNQEGPVSAAMEKVKARRRAAAVALLKAEGYRVVKLAYTERTAGWPDDREYRVVGEL